MNDALDRDIHQMLVELADASPMPRRFDDLGLDPTGASSPTDRGRVRRRPLVVVALTLVSVTMVALALANRGTDHGTVETSPTAMTNDESSVSTTSAASADPEWRRLTITSAPGGPAALVLPGELPASWDAWWATWSPDLPDRSNPTRVVLGRRDDRDAVRAAVAIQFGTAPDDEAINIPLSSDPVTTELWGTTAYVSTILGEPDGLALRTDALSNGTYAAAVASGFTVDELHTLLAGLRLSTSRNESFVDENALPADVVLLSQTETTGRLLVDIWPTDPSLLTLHVGDVVLQASDWVHAERLSDGSAVRIADWFARGWLSDGTAFQLDGAGLDPGTVQRVVEGLTPVSLGALESFNRANPRLDVILPEGSSFSSLQQLILSAYSDAEHPGSVCAGVTGGGGDCFDAPTPPWTKIHTFHLAGWEATVEVTLSPGDPIVNASWKVVDLRCPAAEVGVLVFDEFAGPIQTVLCR
ncbi:MAG: hypothetical protein R2715_15640 [Ilumatobacteraceae bacterium]